jgi:protein tyrosine phosphatase (PTP) superfamily phosphohydrolase (DUF442 family)
MHLLRRAVASPFVIGPLAAAIVCLAGCVSAPSEPAPSGWAVPAEQPTAGNLLVAGQPSPDGLRAFAESGGTTVVAFRTQREMDRLGFDQAQLLEELGLRYEQVDTRSSTLGDEHADAVARAMASGGKILLHCGSGSRAAGALAAYRVKHEGAGFGTAIAEAEVLVGLSSATLIDRVRRIAMGEQPALAAALAAAVDPERLLADVEALASFGTRHTLSDQTPGDGRGIDDATAWLEERFVAIGEQGTRSGDQRFIVELDTHRIAPDGRRIPREAEITNVLCTIPGTDTSPDRGVYYVIAHLDSRASDIMDANIDAPGANDDASGVAALLEIARMLSDQELDATVVLMATSGEEQGLIGARRHAALVRAAGRNIRGVLSNDTIGDPSGTHGRAAREHVRVFSEGIPASLVVRGQQGGNGMRGVDIMRRLGAENDGASRQLARFLAEVAWWHDLPVKPKLVHRADRFLRGGDHTAFNEAGRAVSVRASWFHVIASKISSSVPTPPGMAMYARAAAAMICLRSCMVST